MITEKYRIALNYIDASYFNHSIDKLENTLSKSIELNHQIKNDSNNHAEGKKDVMELFKKIISNSSSQIKLKHFSFKDTKKGLQIKLTVEEKRNKNESHERHLFTEKTLFQFKETKHHHYKILSIKTKIKRMPTIKDTEPPR